MLRIIAILFGILFIFVGVAGFLPDFMMDGYLFGYFMVNGLHNVVHIITGILAIMAATSFRLSKLFFQVFGIIYTLIALIGFWRGDLYIIQVNTADNVFHLVVGIISLLLGFASRKETV